MTNYLWRWKIYNESEAKKIVHITGIIFLGIGITQFLIVLWIILANANGGLLNAIFNGMTLFYFLLFVIFQATPAIWMLQTKSQSSSETVFIITLLFTIVWVFLDALCWRNLQAMLLLLPIAIFWLLLSFVSWRARMATVVLKRLGGVNQSPSPP
jgi:hypothetical protein